jgi:hypothetical protein
MVSSRITGLAEKVSVNGASPGEKGSTAIPARRAMRERRVPRWRGLTSGASLPLHSYIRFASKSGRKFTALLSLAKCW